MARKSTVKYTTNAGKTYKCKLSSDVIAAQPTSPAGTTFDVPIFAKVGASRKTYGIHCRYLNLSRSTGTAPNNIIFKNRMPVMLLADVATLEAAGTVTIGSTVWTIDSQTDEKIR